MSAMLIGVGAFFILNAIMVKGIALPISIILALIAVAALSVFASNLRSRAVRSFVGLTLVFGAIWFGMAHDLLATGSHPS